MIQERKNKRLLISLVVLLMATVVTYYLTGTDNTIRVDKDLFKVQNLERIDKITLTSGSDTIALAFDGTRWLVNDVFKADGNMINVLFATLQQAEAKRPVATNVQDSVASLIREQGVRVSLFQNNGLVKRFYAGGNSAKTQAYFLEEAGEKVYVMTIPGYKVYVSGIFEMDESGWRDKYVFGFNWRNFEKLTASFPAKPSENFEIARDKNYFGIQGLPEVDTAKLNTFLDQVSLLTVDHYVNSKEILDSLQKKEPQMVITISDIGKNEYLLKLFSANSAGQVPGVIGNDEVAFFRQKRILPLLKSKSFFKK